MRGPRPLVNPQSACCGALCGPWGGSAPNTDSCCSTLAGRGRRCGTTVQAVRIGGLTPREKEFCSPSSGRERRGEAGSSLLAPEWPSVSTARKRPRLGKAEATAGMGSQEFSEAEKSDAAGRFRAPSHCLILDIFLKVWVGGRGYRSRCLLAPSGAVSMGHVSLTCWTETSWRSELRSSKTWRTWIR